jgi:MarR family transcriptional regulator, organic hydroperoxide resistance regulator
MGIRDRATSTGAPVDSIVTADQGHRRSNGRRDERAGATEALIELHRAANAMRNHLEQAVLRQESLTWTGFVVLREVWAARQLETRRAAKRAGIAKATLTGVVDTLVRRGLVRRAPHPDDGRLVLLELTRRGQRVLRDLLPASRDEEAFALAYLDEERLSQVTAALRRLVDHLDGDEAHQRRG